MIPCDYHIHTDFSCDCNIPMSEMCRAAVERGIPEIGFAEHFDLVPEDPCYASFQIEAWWKEIERCRDTFRDALQIRAGLEAGEPHRFGDMIQPLLARFPWDYCMGALHWVGSTTIWDRGYYERPEGRAYRDYFRELAQAAEAGGFEILAHMDVLKRYGVEHYGPYDPRRYESEIRAVLRACAEQDIALEINTSSLRRPIHEVSPDLLVLTWFREEGGRWVTLGSDAHLPEHVGFGLDECAARARTAGFSTLARFEKRIPVPLPLVEGREAS